MGKANKMVIECVELSNTDEHLFEDGNDGLACAKCIAHALDAERADRLEEAAKIAEKAPRGGIAYINEPGPYRLADDIAKEIRARAAVLRSDPQ
jgi:hypothetical protein